MPRVLLAIIITALVSAAPAAAGENRFVQGFGGLQLGSFSETDNTAFGGVVGGSLTPNIQVIGEAGRIGNVLPSTLGLLGSFSPIGIGVSAWYGEGGVRFTSDRSTIRPYAEAAAGIARLQTDVAGIDDFGGIFADTAIRFLDRTEPIATVGGGVTFGGGAFLADIGYRYRRVFTSSWYDALALGDTLHSSEVRVGIGIRF